MSRHHHRPGGHHNPPPPPVAHHRNHNHHPGPPPPVHHHHPAPPPPVLHHHPAPPPPVHHHHHPPPPPHHHHTPPVIVFPSPAPRIVVVDHHHHSLPPVVHINDDIYSRPSVMMYCRAEASFSLSVSHGKVILVRSNHSDPLQHWIKDERYSSRVRDEEGLPSFALINKATGQALKHSIGAGHPVQLVQYNPNVVDESILWTEKDLGDGYRAVRMVNNIRLNVDALNGDRRHGGVHDGSLVILEGWKKGDNQRWRIDLHCKSHDTIKPRSGIN